MSSNQTFAHSSTPIVFSVSNFFFLHVSLANFFCPQKTTLEVPIVPNILISPVANPNIPNPLIPLVANPSIAKPLIPPVANPNVPNPNTPFYRSIAGVIYGVGRLIWVSIISILCLFFF